MKILFLGNNWVGWRTAAFLKESGAQIVGAVLHKPEERKFGKELLETLGLDQGRIFDASMLRDSEVLDAIRSLSPDLGVSAYFGTILKKEFLDIFPEGCINVHPALLPFNRGAHPNVWNIVEGSPAGVTVHYIDEGVDTGRIIAQRFVEVRPIDTGKTLYRRLEKACLDLFEETWPKFLAGDMEIDHVVAGSGTFHKVADLKTIQEIKPNKLYTARELVDVIRARTFEPHPGAHMVVDGKKVFMRLELYYEDEDHGGD
ncbi:formyl transferase domain protein [Desulfatibacillum aliphaticivorans]|uniref:Formyl transferase domain protein n=1 Tax=Desulfatibacillum aliphaticivorans TaxID=218208 RepID=B8FJQ8_DESAL|nr:formyltransferase family protein [Desulfatibacillum aliphaticivorans]ACL02336.1 formyl transferase domain protein [Desulfatibacillum aliphaticivorans]